MACFRILGGNAAKPASDSARKMPPNHRLIPAFRASPSVAVCTNKPSILTVPFVGVTRSTHTPPPAGDLCRPMGGLNEEGSRKGARACAG